MESTDHPSSSTSFASSAGTPYAAEAAAEIYRAGGNAADAAVAAAAAVSVTEPLMSSIGGGGFALVRPPGGGDGGAELIDYYDCMPGKGLPASAFGAGGSPTTMILKYGAGVKSIVGAASCAVPGSLRGWETLLERHGKLTLREALAPAVRLAREGFLLCKTSGMWFEVASEVLKLTDETRKNFYTGDRVYRTGEEVRFPELADTLEAVGEAGADLFYTGEFARTLSSYILKMGGIITEEDLATYEAVVREPLSFAYHGRAGYTNGPPSAGGPTLAQILRVVSAYDLASLTESEHAQVLSGAMKYALEDRDRAYTELAENARVAEKLTGEEYAESQRARIFGTAGSAFGHPHTTHLSCVDESGLAVSITASMGYGSGIVVPGTGIPMGNTLGEPELNPKGFHALAPGERLISSMSPTIFSDENGDVISLGSPGASRIPTALAQALVNVVDLGMPLRSAVLAPRLHAEGDLFAYEAGARKPDLSLYERVLNYDEPSMFFGAVNAVRRSGEGLFEAAADPRRSGGVAFA
ncbi:MAG: gamma-glutamyltransferase family protein [Actinomycetota bacterium]|nr:gamma-glutamyltransferase family protein [Actinomycetota bacterium]